MQNSLDDRTGLICVNILFLYLANILYVVGVYNTIGYRKLKSKVRFIDLHKKVRWIERRDEPVELCWHDTDKLIYYWKNS